MAFRARCLSDFRETGPRTQDVIKSWVSEKVQIRLLLCLVLAIVPFTKIKLTAVTQILLFSPNLKGRKTFTQSLLFLGRKPRYELQLGLPLHCYFWATILNFYPLNKSHLLYFNSLVSLCSWRNCFDARDSFGSEAKKEKQFQIQFNSHFSAPLPSSSAKTLLAVNNNPAGYAGYSLVNPLTSLPSLVFFVTRNMIH